MFWTYDYEAIRTLTTLKSNGIFLIFTRLNIRLGLNSRGRTFHDTPSEEKEDYSACMLRKSEQILLRL